MRGTARGAVRTLADPENCFTGDSLLSPVQNGEVVSPPRSNHLYSGSGLSYLS